MKNVVLFFALAMAFIINPFLAHAAEDHSRGISELLTEIINDQGVSKAADLDCAKINDDKLEELGDAVMSLMHPDEAAHTAMDAIMGGEGSDSLRAAHIYMAKSYLGCDLGGYGMMGMMGSGMMINGNYGSGYGMMNDNYNNLFNKSLASAGEKGGFSMMSFPIMGSNFGFGSMIFGWLLMIIFWAFIIAGIVWFIKLLAGGGSKTGGQMPLEILKARYAKGEINKKEFEQMKKDLN